MEPPLDISEVARRTGLTSRTLRFYEGRGLLRPLRTYSGRRLYGAGELERLNTILALKRAGLTISQIGRLLGGRSMSLEALVEAQLEELGRREAELTAARTLLHTVKSRIDRGEPVDAATFCSLIRQGENTMTTLSWDEIAARYMGPEEQAEWNRRLAALPQDFDQGAYDRSWRDLGARIAAAMPLEPSSEQAQAFVDEWFALLKPFSEVASPAMWSTTHRMYDDMQSWAEQGDAPFSPEVWEFMKIATGVRLATMGAGEPGR